MFDVPSQQGVKEIVINEAAILHKEAPLIVMGQPDDPPPPPQPTTLTRA
jgi:ATP-dependent protease Clp ATPase subunit